MAIRTYLETITRLIYKIIKDDKNLFRLNKENKVIKGRTIRDILTLFKSKKENYYKSVRVCKFIATIILNLKAIVIKAKYSIKEYLDEIKWYIKDVIDNLKKSDIN